MTVCPSPPDLERAFAALLEGGDEPTVVAHVERCAACQGRLEGLLEGGGYSPRYVAPTEASGDSHSSAHDLTADATPRATLASPDRLPEVPGYEILGLLGRGGMGVVYKARHERLNRVVALKMILAGELADADKLARFHLEAEAVARLRHPNIVQIHDIGTANGVPYIALEYLPGGSLEQRLHRGPQPPDEAAALLAALAQAVHTAHLAGIVHRDLKPSNILIAEDATARLTDFGLAKRMESPGHTQSGQIIGTPAYMAPEQAKGESKAVGPAADVYALGAVLYETLTGRPPFRGETVMQTLQMVLVDEPSPPRKLVPGVPADLETVCLKALRKDARERYATAQELADELDRFLHDEPVRARPLRRLEKAYRWCRRNPAFAWLSVAAAGLLLMAGVTSILGFYHVRLQGALAGEKEQHDRAEDALRKANRYLYFNRIHQASQAYRDVQMGRASQVLKDCDPDERGWEWHYLNRITQAHLLVAHGHTQPVLALAFARHGRWMVSGSGDRSVLFWEPSSAKMLLKLTGHSGPVWDLSLSPDGTRLATVAGSAEAAGEVIVWRLTEGASLQAEEVFRFEGVGERARAAFHPTRPLLAVATGARAGQPAAVVFLDGQGREVGRRDEQAGRCVAVAWSRDGRHLASSWASGDPSRATGQVVIRDVQTGEVVHRLSPDPHDGETLALASSEDGRWLATAGSDRLIHVWDTRDYTRKQTLRGHAGAVHALTFSATGRLVSGGNDTTVRVWNPTTGQELAQRRGHLAPVRCVAIRPPTGHLYSGGDDVTIKAWQGDNSQESDAYSLHEGPATAVAFSPEGAALVSVGEDGAVWRVAPAGPEKPRKLLHVSRPLRQVRYSPDGRAVLVVGGAAKPGQDDGSVQILDAQDGTTRGELATGLAVGSSLFLSRDGRWLSVVGRTKERATVVQVWDMTSRQRTHEIPAEGAVAALLLAGGTRLVVLIETPQTDEPAGFLVFDLPAGSRLNGLSVFAMGPRFAVLPRDESFLLAGGHYQRLSLYPVGRAGTIVSRQDSLIGHAGTIHNAVLSPDEKMIATASEDETIRLWDRETQTELLVLRGDSCPMNDVAFSPAGGLLAAAQANGTVRVWDGSPKPSVRPPRGDENNQ